MPRSALAARSFFRDPVGYVHAHAGESPIVRLAAGPRSGFVLLRDPDAVWRVLVTDAGSFRPGKWKRRARRFLGPTLNTLDGADHRRRRLLLQPALDRRRIATFVPAMVARAERAQDGWEPGIRIQLRDVLDRLSLGIAGDVLLSTELEPGAAALAEDLAAVMRAVPRLTPPIGPTPGGRHLARADRVVRTLIAERRRFPLAEDDLIGLLLESGLPETTVRGELIAFLLASVDEPPSALEAAWYLLGRNRDAERHFHAELDAVLGDRPLTLADRERLEYVDAVLRETLRLFPPARHIDRCPVHDAHIGDALVEAGSNVIISPLVTHRDPGLYDRASEFVPERWLDAGSHSGARGAYLPFGAGPHACIGEPLATAVITFTLATIGRRWQLRVHPDAPAPVPRAPKLVVTLERR